MGEGFIQGMQMANQMWSPYVQSDLEAKRLKQKLLLERDIQQELLGQTAQGLQGLGLFNKTEKKQVMDPNMPVPQFKTDYGMKSPAFQSGTGQPVAPTGSQRTAPVQLIDSQGNVMKEQQLSAEEIKRKLEMLQTVGGNINTLEGRSTANLGMINALTEAGQKLENMPADVDPNSIQGLQAFRPQMKETVQEVPMTAEDIKALLNANMAKDYIEPAMKQKEVQQKLQMIESLGLSPEDYQNAAVGIVGGTTGLGGLSLPMKLANLESQIANRTWNQDFKEKRFEFDKEKFDRSQSEIERRDMVREAINKGQLTVQQGNLLLDQAKFQYQQQPTRTTQEIDSKGNVTKVTTKGQAGKGGTGGKKSLSKAEIQQIVTNAAKAYKQNK